MEPAILKLGSIRRSHPTLTSIEVHAKPSITVHCSRTVNDRRTKVTYEMGCSTDAWRHWLREAVVEWWTVSTPELPVLKDGHVVPGRLLVYDTNRVWQEQDVTVYHHAGVPRLYWMDPAGIYAWESISTIHGGSYAVVSSTILCEEDRAWLRGPLLVTHPGGWVLPPATHDSTSLTSQMAIADGLPEGVARPLVDRTAAWLRQVLPMYKVGAPSLEDVQLKLSLEKRLRIEEQVVGSVRPLAFTLQAIDDATFTWPGLWLHSGSTGDFRAELSALLAWDATLAAVAAVARLHVDVKPGLWFGTGISQTVHRLERRFSKRDVGPTTAAYSQINPTRLAGAAPVVACRLLQAATHELTHLNLHELQPHSEIFTARREQLFLTATELLPALIELVQSLGLDLRPARTLPVPPIVLDQWIHEALTTRRSVPIAQLAQAWSAVRNLTEGRADRDIRDAVAQLALSGRCTFDALSQVVSLP
jgi:hypothetical protein